MATTVTCDVPFATSADDPDGGTHAAKWRASVQTKAPNSAEVNVTVAKDLCQQHLGKAVTDMAERGRKSAHFLRVVVDALP